MTLRQQLQHIITSTQATGRGSDFLAKVILYWLEVHLGAGLLLRGHFDGDMSTYNLLRSEAAIEYRRCLEICGIVNDESVRELDISRYITPDYDEDLEASKFLASIQESLEIPVTGAR